MNPGQLKHRIEIQELVEDCNDNGYLIEDWQTKIKLWSKIITVKGSETIKADKEFNFKTYRFIVRYIEGLSEKQRIIYKKQVFDIDTILADDEIGKTLTIIALSRGEFIEN